VTTRNENRHRRVPRSLLMPAARGYSVAVESPQGALEADPKSQTVDGDEASRDVMILVRLVQESKAR
jgi:hypothetical protein